MDQNRLFFKKQLRNCSRIFVCKDWLLLTVTVFSYFLLGHVPVTNAQRSGPSQRQQQIEESPGNPGDRLILTPFLNNGSACILYLGLVAIHSDTYSFHI